MITTFSYNKNGSIKEEYTYLLDPCMGLNNHFTLKYVYHDNGLVKKIDVYEEGNLAFIMTYEYDFFE